MGFMDISVSGSDEAADTASLIADKAYQVIKKEFKTPETGTDLDGPVAAAVIFEELIIPASDYYAGDERFGQLAEEIADALKGMIANPYFEEFKRRLQELAKKLKAFARKAAR